MRITVNYVYNYIINYKQPTLNQNLTLTFTLY